MSSAVDTIVALATPMGRGGIGIVRVSGPRVKEIAEKIVLSLPSPRQAHHASFVDDHGDIIDQGIALFFPNPHSFTGEDVLELQGHGGRIVMESLIKRIISLGARLARPGEFSERAFLNDKIDLTQAEAIADLIDASSEQAARAAMRSLQGEFSSVVNILLESLIQLRMYVEAAIDFPEEEVDFLNEGEVTQKVENLISKIDQIKAIAKQGVILKEGLKIVIAGAPNAGKSSLLNQLSGYEAAIVTDIPGTTRDVLREHISMDGLPLHIIDTAGLRESTDKVEVEGIRRAWNEISQADHILFVVDSTEFRESDIQEKIQSLLEKLRTPVKITLVKNKIDLVKEHASCLQKNDMTVIYLSAKTGEGIDVLKAHLKTVAGYQSTLEGNFSARRRHVEALENAQQAMLRGQEQLKVYRSGELLAEEMRIAQQYLSEITGEFTSDDLLGKIFSSFCIGK